jgi:hypothetical protein
VGVGRVTRTRKIGDETTTEVVHGITSLSAGKADAAKLRGDLSRAPGTSTRSSTCGTSRWARTFCRVRTGSAPEVLAAARNVCITLLRQAGYKNIKEAIEYLSEHREAALMILLCGRT